jgi:integrase
MRGAPLAGGGMRAWPTVVSAVTTAMTSAYIARWGPPSVSVAAAGFARAVVAGCGDLDRERAKSLLWAAARLGDHGIALGLAAVPEVLLHPSVIERFCAHSPGLSPSARRTLRTNLRFIARRVVPALRPPDAPLGRERAKAPYNPAEIAGFLALAGAQPTPGRRMRASALICLGAGAGLTATDLRAVRGTDVTARSGGVIVAVRGARPRAVPALAGYHARLLEAAAFAGGRLIIGGRNPARRNVTSLLTSRLAGGAGLPPLDAARLRSTWLRDCAGLLGLPAFMRAAGITCSQRLGDIIAGLEPGSEAEAVALLGGAR